jgi:hypothetical protein
MDKTTEETDEVTTEVDTSSEETEEESEEKSSSQEEIDYEAELIEEKKRGTPDPEIAKKAFKEREEKRKHKEEEEDDTEDEDKPLTRKDLQSIRHQMKSEVYSDRIQEIASELSSSTAEANLTIEIHKNRVYPESMPLKEQLEEAWIIANRKKILSKNKELGRALLSRKTASQDTATTHRDKMEGSTPKMNASDADSYKRAGYEYDAKNRVYKKKLPSGKWLVKDPKTKVTRTVTM